MPNKITLLGTGTNQLQTHRMASSVLVEFGDLKLVYDIGRGVSMRLVEAGMKQDDLQHIILSHFHPDHWSDIVPYLHAASWSKIDPRHSDLNIYGPPGVKRLMEKILGLTGPNELTREHFHVVVHEIEADQFSIGNNKFAYIELPPAGNHGLKFEANGMKYAFTGDSDVHDQEVSFLKDVDVAVIDSGHPSDEEVVDLAVRTEARMIVCSHLYRELSAEELNKAAKAKGYIGKLVVGKDLMSWEI